MRQLETCSHCGYALPDAAATCAGCGRRHRLSAPQAPRRLPKLSHHLGLAGPARSARRLLVATGWAGVGCSVACAVAITFTFPRFTDEVGADVPRRIGEVAESLGLLTLVLLGLATVGLAEWVRRSRHTLPALGLAPRWTSAWSLGGWARPGDAALRERLVVDAQWRDTSTAVAGLPHASRNRHYSRHPVSRVALRWWAPWLAVPAVATLGVLLAGEALEVTPAGRATLALPIVAVGLLVVALRSTYDVLGIVTVAQTHRADALLRSREQEAAATPAPRRVVAPLVVGDREQTEADADAAARAAELEAALAEVAGWAAGTGARSHADDDLDPDDDLDLDDLGPYFAERR